MFPTHYTPPRRVAGRARHPCRPRRRIASVRQCRQPLLPLGLQPQRPGLPRPDDSPAGTSPENLQVHIVGEAFDTLEVFYKENLYRETLTGSANLHCNNSVLLAPLSDFGTFAVRLRPLPRQLQGLRLATDGQEGTGLLRRVASRGRLPDRDALDHPQILKVNYGPNGCKEFILKFNGGNTCWDVIYQTGGPYTFECGKCDPPVASATHMKPGAFAGGSIRPLCRTPSRRLNTKRRSPGRGRGACAGSRPIIRMLRPGRLPCMNLPEARSTVP